MRRNKLSRDAVRRDGDPGNGIAGLGNTATNVTGAPSAGGVAVTASRTDHTHQGVHSILPATNSGLSVTPPTGLGDVVIDSAAPGANWPIANMRIYAVDFVNGLDTNIGFADAAGTSAADYAAACALAGTRAKKTIAGLSAIFPRVGNGRLAEIVLANGGVNTEQSYADALSPITSGLNGYPLNNLLIRATGTNTTAGAVAFAGTTNDVDYQGAITAAGCNAPGYNPVAAFSTSVIKCLKVGGGAAAIPAEPAAPLGWRIRFDNATTTAALRNVCVHVSGTTGTDTVLLSTVLPAVPVGTDTFYLEQAGVAVPAWNIAGCSPGSSVNISGLRSTGTIAQSSSNVRWAFCGCNLFNVNTAASVLTINSIAHAVLGTRTVGGGMRSATSSQISNSPGGCSLTRFTTAVGTTTLTALSSLTWGLGNFAGGIINVNNSHCGGGNTAENVISLGVTDATTVGVPRLVGVGTGGLRINGCTLLLGKMDLTNVGPAGAVQVNGSNNTLGIVGVISGATGNTSVGITVNPSRGTRLAIVVTPTVTGTFGDLQLGGTGGAVVTWAQAVATGLVDEFGTRILGQVAGNTIAAQSMDTKSGVVLSSLAGAVFTYIADENPTSLGSLVIINNIVPVRWATSFRAMTRLRACYLDPDPATRAIVATLYKNNVATAMTVTIPIGSAVGFKVVDLAHPILFLDGDDWAIRLDCPIAGAEGPTAYAVGVTVEWAV